jgi:NAD(P)-dependent dehydrogenase (short-subunit alcohol dehydrogenase family)
VGEQGGVKMKVVVTGSERGIGKAIARELCKRGHFYYGFSRWNDIDISNYSCVQKAFDELKNTPPEVLINNAGIVEIGGILELTPDAWHRQFAVNMNGIFYCTKEYVRIVKEVGGKIINIASTAGLGARPGRSAYAASKAAVINFSLSMAEELRPYGIKVYCIAPGAVNTDMRHEIAPDDDFENMMQPEELTRLVVDIVEDGHMLDNQVILARGGKR